LHLVRGLDPRASVLPGAQMSNVISLGERRADAQNDCNAWTPQELLESILHRIERGEIAPNGMCVSWFTKEGDSTRTSFRRSRMTTIEAVGLLEVTKSDLLADTAE
jgi:hypothetical protein